QVLLRLALDLLPQVVRGGADDFVGLALHLIDQPLDLIVLTALLETHACLRSRIAATLSRRRSRRGSAVQWMSHARAKLLRPWPPSFPMRRRSTPSRQGPPSTPGCAITRGRARSGCGFTRSAPAGRASPPAKRSTWCCVGVGSTASA